MSNQSVNVLNNFKYNKIPEFAREYKREYQFIRGINKEFKYMLNKMYQLNDELFESNISIRIKNFMKRFLLAQEKGKLKDISDLVFTIEDLYNIKFIDKHFGFRKLQYDTFDDGEKYYPGFREFYDIFKNFFNQLKFDCCDRVELELFNTDDIDEYFNHLHSFYSLYYVNLYLKSRERTLKKRIRI